MSIFWSLQSKKNRDTTQAVNERYRNGYKATTSLDKERGLYDYKTNDGTNYGKIRFIRI